MFITNKLLGGILLVAGTTIGAGMLALPVITAFAGFWPSIALFFFCWLLMLATAFFFLDVNLSLSDEPNLISMAGKTLGPFGKAISWIFYLLLLYSLTAAYIAGSTPLFVQAISFLTGCEIPHGLAYFTLPALFGGFIYLGTGGVDYVNRLLMTGLAVSYLFLAAFIPSHFEWSYLAHRDSPALLVAVTVLFTSFGYHVIIPSLTTYMEHNRKQLRLAIVIGSIIPLIIYITWQLLIHGSIPTEGLVLAWRQGEPATEPLARALNTPFIVHSAKFFSFFAITTSFLGVSLSLSDFLTDGLKIKKNWKGRLGAIALTFTPPLIFVFFCEKGFYFALQHAGVSVAILLGIVPACMAWTLQGEKYRFYRSWPGRALLIAIIGLSSLVVLLDILQHRDQLGPLVQKYLV